MDTLCFLFNTFLAQSILCRLLCPSVLYYRKLAKRLSLLGALINLLCLLLSDLDVDSDPRPSGKCLCSSFWQHLRLHWNDRCKNKCCFCISFVLFLITDTFPHSVRLPLPHLITTSFFRWSMVCIFNSFWPCSFFSATMYIYHYFLLTITILSAKVFVADM